ncbi:MAG: RNA polymerase sigma factor [Gemmatimonadaceae bacterium]
MPRSEEVGPPSEAGADDELLSQRIEGLVTRWSGAIQRAGRQYGLSRADLDEVTQDVRLRLWRLLEREGPAPASVNATYAYRAATSAAIDLVRRDRISRSGSMIALDDVPPPSAPNDTDLLQRLAEALEHLQRSRRVAVRLHLDGRSLGEIARVLGWTPAQARNQVYRGLGDLRRVLTMEGEPRP